MTADHVEFASKTVVVTGAGSGIGEGIARRFAEDGARVVIGDLDLAMAERTAARIHDRGGMAVAVRADVATRADVDALVDLTMARHGRIDVLVNNAGMRPIASTADTTDAQWHQALDVNLTGTFYCTRAVATTMIAAGVAGSIINIASTAGMQGVAGRGAYGAAKAGVLLLTQVAALDLAPHGIRVNAIAPGGIDTPLTAQFRLPAEEGSDASRITQRYVDNMPLGRWGTPDDIAAACRFLASAEAAYVTGTTLVVDGGLSLT